MDKFKTVTLTERQIDFLCYLVEEHTADMRRWKQTKPSNTEDANRNIERNQKIIEELKGAR